VVVCCTVVWVTGVETTGVVVVCVTTAVLVAAVVLAALVEVDVDVCVRDALAFAFSGGMGAPDCGPVTVACAPVPEPLAASDPECAGAELDFTALPMPKPAAIAMISSAPSSHHRCFMSRHPFTRFQP
jgi:hypothetical protein